MIAGTLLAMIFRWWALKKWVFPERSNGAVPRPVPVATDETSKRVA
jgi:hypothetical protein